MSCDFMHQMAKRVVYHDLMTDRGMFNLSTATLRSVAPAECVARVMLEGGLPAKQAMQTCI
jgi:hypothetical protein